MVTFYPTQPEARADAAARGLREKVVCFVMRGEASPELLVFDHVPDDSGVQLPAGGVEPGETPEQAALRELREESGLNLTGPEFLTSYLWEAQLPQRFTRQVCHAFLLRAPHDLPHTWERDADGERFAFRWASLHAPALDWEMDAALPWARAALRPAPSSAPPDGAESVILPN